MNLRSYSLAKLLSVFVVAATLVSGAASAAQQLAASAVQQMAALKGIKANKTPTQNKIDSRLFLGALHARRDGRLAPLTEFRFVTAAADGRVAIDVAVTSAAGIKPVMQAIENLGGSVQHASRAYRTISARLPLTQLEALAALSDVRKIRQPIPAYTHAINVSEGDATHATPLARSLYGTNGTGVKVCVLSDGVDSLAALQGTGDLPAVDVLPGQAGSGDEGSAMLEIIHDLAPGATLGFATAVNSEAEFAQNILDLATDGCNIIVDDIIYLDESPFQDGAVAQAVNTVTAGGVLYFSSAGNEGNADDLTSGTWEGDFLASAAPDPAPLAGANLHNFGDGGNSILVEFGGGNPPLLIWAEHYDLATGLASTDFDIYDMDGGLTTIFDASTDVQDGVGGDDFPIEFIAFGTFGGERLLIDKFAAGSTSSVPMFNLIVFRGELDDNLVTPGTTRGHSAAAEAFSVAATPAGPSFDGVTPDGPFPGVFTAANESESFTSDGPRRIILGPTGTELTAGNRTSTGGVVRQKPDITAADGVSTAAPGFNPFYGTSAAAPHAAAIAALIKSALPAATPAQIRTALVSSAIDIEAPGVDIDTGAGIIMADAALAAAGAPVQAFLDDGTWVFAEVAGDGDAFAEPNEIWNITIPLTNIGGAGATGISGTVSTLTAGVTMLNAVSAYSDLAPTVSANNQALFTFLVGPAAVCGGLVDFTLQVTYTGGPSPQSFPESLALGAPGAPVTVSYTNPVVPIPDSPGPAADATLAVAAIPGNLVDVDLRIDGTVCTAAAGATTVGIDHTFVADLQVSLISPAATSVTAINFTDGGGNNFCQTLLDDESVGASIQSVASGAAPFTGSFTPNSALSAFDGEAPNGNWILRVQDFAGIDTGNIRAWSLILTPAVCDAPPLVAAVVATKTVTGTFLPGGTVTYTVTLNNAGGLSTGDNPGDEDTDVLPSQLTLVSANATSGTAVATVGTNTVTWNGSVGAGGSVTISITATINAGIFGLVSNQGGGFFDINGDGTNDGIYVTDDPGLPGVADPTVFAVPAVAAASATKSVSGSFVVGTNVVYTVVLTNNGTGVAGDNPGDEFTDILPPELALISAVATSGTAGTAGNTVTWNGSIPVAGSVTITITASIVPGTPNGTQISNQGSGLFDSNADGTNDAAYQTDAPGGGANEPTAFIAQAQSAVEIPTASSLGLMMLGLLLAAAAFTVLRLRA